MKASAVLARRSAPLARNRIRKMLHGTPCVAEDRSPAQAGLKSLEADLFEQAAIVGDREPLEESWRAP